MISYIRKHSLNHQNFSEYYFTFDAIKRFLIRLLLCDKNYFSVTRSIKDILSIEVSNIKLR